MLNRGCGCCLLTGARPGGAAAVCSRVLGQVARLLSAHGCWVRWRGCCLLTCARPGGAAAVYSRVRGQVTRRMRISRAAGLGSSHRRMCLVLVATHCVDGPMTGFKSTETQDRDGARIAEEPTKKILETQIVSMSSFIMVGSVDRGPARLVGPPNLKSGGCTRSRGRARRGAAARAHECAGTKRTA